MQSQVSINEFVLELNQDGPLLFGGECTECGNYTFPVLAGCPKCAGTDIVRKPLGRTGTLWAWTVQGFPPKNPPYLGENNPDKFQSFGVGYIELPEVIVEARLTESEPAKLKTGIAMELVLEPLYTNENGEQVVTYAFQPAEN